jgi:hypothetical protein
VIVRRQLVLAHAFHPLTCLSLFHFDLGEVIPTGNLGRFNGVGCTAALSLWATFEQILTKRITMAFQPNKSLLRGI